MLKKRIASVGIVLLLLSVILFFYFDVFRTFQTVWLITQVSPFEQEGDGSISLLIIGDSTGYGTGASRAEETVAGYIGAAYPGLTIRNASRNGATLSQVHDQLDGVFKDGTNFDIVLLEGTPKLRHLF